MANTKLVGKHQHALTEPAETVVAIAEGIDSIKKILLTPKKTRKHGDHGIKYKRVGRMLHVTVIGGSFMQTLQMYVSDFWQAMTALETQCARKLPRASRRLKKASGKSCLAVQ